MFWEPSKGIPCPSAFQTPRRLNHVRGGYRLLTENFQVWRTKDPWPILSSDSRLQILPRRLGVCCTTPQRSKKKGRRASSLQADLWGCPNTHGRPNPFLPPMADTHESCPPRRDPDNEYPVVQVSPVLYNTQRTHRNALAIQIW